VHEGGKNCCKSIILGPWMSAFGNPEPTNNRACDVDSAVNGENITTTIKVITSILVLNLPNLLLVMALNL
jgi:hypothetical protein